MEEERKDPPALIWSNDDGEVLILEIPQLDFSFDRDKTGNPFKHLEDRETLLNAQPVASNERDFEENIDVLPPYSLATPQRTVSGHEENFQNRLSASSNSHGSEISTEISSLEKQVPNDSSSDTFHPNPEITLDISTSDLNEPIPLEPSDTARRNPGRILDDELPLNTDLSFQNPDGYHYSGYMSQDRPTINSRKRNLPFKYSPGKRIMHPGYSSVSETDYIPKTSSVGPETQNRRMDSIEKNRYFRGLKFFKELTNVNHPANAETENNEEPQLSGNAHAPSASEHSRINTDSVRSKNLGSGENHKGYSYAGGKSFKCEVCGILYSSKDILNKHLRIHTGDKPFQCEFCEKRFTYKTDLQRHLRIHTGDKPFECEFCKKRFTQKIVLQRHLLTHSEKKGVKCEQCGKSYPSNDVLEAHLKTTRKKSNQCRVCYKYFSSKCSLNTHRQMHWGQKTAVCDFCKKGFVNKIYLGKHIQICPKKRPFKCNKCGEEFANENDLENHIRTHNLI